ncbi:MAG: ATP cone domain-containing protein, partial [Sulfolobaceae archaeon]
MQKAQISILSLAKLKVIKRNNSVEEFKSEKIFSKLLLPEEVIDGILNDIAQNAKDNAIDSRTIADIVERNLIEHSLDYPELMETAKR